MFKVHNEYNRTMSMALPWCLYGKIWTSFTPCSSVSIVDLGHAFIHWAWWI